MLFTEKGDTVNKSGNVTLYKYILSTLVEESKSLNATNILLEAGSSVALIKYLSAYPAIVPNGT